MIRGNLAVFQAAIFPQGSFPCTANPDGSVNTDPSCEVTLPATRPDFAPSYRYHWAVCAQTVRELAHDSRSTTAPATNITACSTMIISARIQLTMAAREPVPATRKVSAPLAPHSPVGQLWEPDRDDYTPGWLCLRPLRQRQEQPPGRAWHQLCTQLRQRL